MNWPSFSIVIPTFQRRDLVCDAIRAVCSIDYPGPVEVIVVVDGSTDGTADAVSAIDCPFPLDVIAQPNTGLAAARNRGAAEASGEFILFLDDDMICSRDVLRQHVATHAEGADAVLGHIPLDPGSPDTFLASAAGTWADQRAQRLKQGAPLTLFDLICGHMSVRRSVFEETGGFDQQFTRDGHYGDEDLDLGVRLFDRYEIRFNPNAIARQRYVVTPRQYLRQWNEAGRADVAFAHKHPDRAAELFELHGSRTAVARLLLRPLAAIPLIADAITGIAGFIGERETLLPRGSRKVVGRLFRDARDLSYWAGVRDAHRQGSGPKC